MPDTADIADIYRNFSVDVMPLASSVDATSGPDLSVATSMAAADSGAYYADTPSGGGSTIRNPSPHTAIDQLTLLNGRRTVNKPGTPPAHLTESEPETCLKCWVEPNTIRQSQTVPRLMITAAEPTPTKKPHPETPLMGGHSTPVTVELSPN